MTRSTLPGLTFLLAAGLLCGCASPPTHFYTIEPVAPQGPVLKASGAPVKISVLHIPPELDRLSMVRETGPAQLAIDDQDRWGASLRDLARNALAQDLAARLPPGMVVLPDAPEPSETRTVTVDITQFAPDPSGQTVLDASWSLLRGGQDQPVLRRHLRLVDSNPAPDAAAQAAAMSRLIGRLADAIAQTLPGGS